MDKSECELSDYQLVKRHKDGDNRAFLQLIDRYKSILSAKSKKFYFLGADSEDVYQEGMIALNKAINNYRKDGGLGFRDFVFMCIDRHMFTAIKSAQCSKNIPLQNYNNLLELIDSLEDNREPLKELLLKEKIGQIVSAQHNYFSETEREVFSNYLSGLTYKQIALKLKISEKSVDNALQRARQKLRLALNRYEEIN